LSLDEIIFDDDFQSRADLHSQEDIDDLAELMKEKKVDIPRLKIANVKGIGYICTDGFKRGAALQKAGKKTAQVEITLCSLFEARIAAATANRDQVAKSRSRADKRRAVELFFAAVRSAGEAAEEEWSNRKIGDALAVSEWLVRDVRGPSKVREHAPEKSEEIEIEDDDEMPVPASQKPAPKPSIEGDWRQTPIDDFIDCSNQMWDSLESKRVKTAGDLLDRINKKEPFGEVSQAELADVKKQIEALDDDDAMPDMRKKTEPAPKKQGAPKGFDIIAFNQALGVVARGPDGFVEYYPQFKRSAHYNQCIDAITRFGNVWTDMVKRVEGAQK
jgi:hypothetical protein